MPVILGPVKLSSSTTSPILARWSIGLPISFSSQLVALASASLADVQHRLTAVEVDVDLSALTWSHTEVIGVTNVDGHAVGWENVFIATHSVLLSGYTYIISTRKG